jgi:ABC-2 type transport system ATP-binding protein
MAQLVQLLGSVVHRPKLLVLDDRQAVAQPLGMGHDMGGEQDRRPPVALTQDQRLQPTARVRYRPRDPDRVTPTLLPADAVRDGADWRFPPRPR